MPRNLTRPRSRGGRWDDDAVDSLCKAWAVERRKMLGIVLPKMMTEREKLGGMNSTLGRVREEGEGAAQGVVSQSFPEVYVGEALEVHRCHSRMPGAWREVMHAHYVWWEISPRLKAEDLGLTPQRYFERLELLKVYVAGSLGLDVGSSVRRFFPRGHRYLPQSSAPPARARAAAYAVNDYGLIKRPTEAPVGPPRAPGGSVRRKKGLQSAAFSHDREGGRQ